MDLRPSTLFYEYCAYSLDGDEQRKNEKKTLLINLYIYMYMYILYI